MSVVGLKTFEAVYYDFSQATIVAEATAINNAEKIASVFLDNLPKTDPDYFVKVCKYYQALISARVKLSDFGDDACEHYVSHLIDLYRFEEAREFCQQWALKKPDNPVVDSCLFTIALLQDNLEEAKKYIVEDIEPDDNIVIWTQYILYHSLNGTLCEVAAKEPQPIDIRAQTLLAFHSGNYHLAVEIFRANKELIQGELKWIYLVACAYTGDNEESEKTLKEIIKNPPAFHSIYYRERIFEVLVTKLKKPFVEAICKRYLELRPNCVMMLRILGLNNPEKQALFLSDLKKLTDLYPSVELRRIAINSGPLSPAGKAQILKLTLKDKPHFFTLRDIADFSAVKDKKLRPEVYKPYVHFRPLYRQSFVLTLCDAADTANQGEVEEALKELDAALKETPNLMVLHKKKFYLSKSIGKHEAMEEALQFILKSIHYYPETASELTPHLVKMRRFKDAIFCLTKAFAIDPKATTYESLKNLLKEHGTQEDYVKFLIENHNFDVTCIDLQRAVEKIKDYSPYVEILKKQLQFSFHFVALRSLIYDSLNLLQLALNDVEWLCAKSDDKKFKTIRFQLLIMMERFSDAASYYLNEKFTFFSDEVSLLINHLYHHEKNYALICKIYKKNKELCQTSRCFVASSYVKMAKFDHALAVANPLQRELPDHKDLLLIRIEAYFFKGGVDSFVIDLCKEGLAGNHRREIFQSFLDATLKRQNTLPQEKESSNRETVARPSKTAREVDLSKIPHFVGEKTAKEVRKEDPKGPKLEKVKKVLQNSSAHAVDPLADPLADIKRTARKGETQTGPKPKEAPAPEPAAAPRMEAPRPIVKLHLKPEEKVFLRKAWDALHEYSTMSSVDPDIIFRSQIYTILRVFTPLRLNCTHRTLKSDLIRIRDQARHNTDLISSDRLATLFKYLDSIHLKEQLKDWIHEKSIITRIMLSNQIITVRRAAKTPAEKVIAELEFIQKSRGEEGSWKNRLHDRNAIKASLSIIGEASNQLSDDLKAELASFREAGNMVAHQFFINGETIENLDRFKEEDISPENLWALIQSADTLLKKLKP